MSMGCLDLLELHVYELLELYCLRCDCCQVLLGFWEPRAQSLAVDLHSTDLISVYLRG